MTAVMPLSQNEPSDAAWRRSGDIAARILENLAQRDARAMASRAPLASKREADAA